MDAHLSKQFWGPMALSGSSWKRWIAKPWGRSQRHLAAYLYIFQTNVELETLFNTITKGDGELDGDSLDSTWSRFERNTGKHMQRYTWPHISCTRKIHGKTIVIPFFCTLSRMKVDKDFLKNLTIIKNTIMRDQKNECGPITVPRPIRDRASSPTLYERRVGSLTYHRIYMCKGRPYLRRLPSLCVWRCFYKSSTFSSVIYRP